MVATRYQGRLESGCYSTCHRWGALLAPKCCRLVSSELRTSSLRAPFVSPVTAGAHCLTPEPSSMVSLVLGCVDAHGLCVTGGSFLLLCQLAAVNMTKTLLLKHFVTWLNTIACCCPGYAVQVPLTASPSTALGCASQLCWAGRMFRFQAGEIHSAAIGGRGQTGQAH
jgi:hypothetical protein